MSSVSGPSVAPILEAEIEISAPPAAVWRLVSDPVLMGRLSPQVLRTRIRGGGPARLGTRTFNINRKGLLLWGTRAKVVSFEPERHYAFRVKDNFSIWSFTLEPTENGTRIIHRRETPDGVSGMSAKLTDRFMGGQAVFTAELQRGLGQTLRRLKAEAERTR